tara:strand:+ start:189 stop:1823 length:1635 start_codon:yes stop_codon:yes gene_type:complete
MTQLFILLFFYFLILFSILGYGRIVTLFNSNYQASSFDGLIGISILILISFITNIFFSHNFFHNSLIIVSGLIFFCFDLKKNFSKRSQELILTISVFAIIFIGVLMYKNHDDFYYYHFPYSVILTNFEKIFGLGNLNHGFRTPSSIFYLNSLFFLPIIKYSLMNTAAIYIFGFSNLVLIKLIRDFISKKNVNFIFFLTIFSFIFINTKFSRFSEHGTDLSALILIFIMTIYYLTSVNSNTVYSQKNFFYEYFTKINILFIIIISLKTFYIIYFLIYLAWIFENRNFFYKENSKRLIYTNYSTYIFIFTLFFVFFTIFSNTGCLIYPASFTCFDQFTWSISIENVREMSLWYEQWSKAGAGPNFRVENPEIYVSNLNWFNNWFKLYFFTKVSDNLLIIFVISFITFITFFYKSSINKIGKIKFKLIYILIFILFAEWFYNHPSLRYGGYTLIALIFFIPLSVYLSKFKLDINKVKKRTIFLFVLTVLIFSSKNLVRIYEENKKYGYNPIIHPFFYLNKDGFKINDNVEKFYKNKKKKDLFLIIKN